MIKHIFLALLFIVSSNCLAQFHITYKWESNPKLHELSEEDNKLSSVGILKKHIVEYFAQDTEGIPTRYETEHTITRVNDDKGIARHNTVYIPMYEVKQVVDIKARTISPSGKITVLNKDNIKEIKNVEEYGDFKIFAIEGVEKGSDIEVLYTVEKDFDMYGSEVIQQNYKINTAEFIFITDNLYSNIKAYRAKEEFKDAVIDDKLAKTLTLSNIPAMIEEEYATPDANRIAVVYQCFPPRQRITQEMFWDNIAYNVGSQFFPNSILPKAMEDVQIILDGETNISNFEKASRVDNFIKNNFNVIQNNNEELINLDYILEHRASSDYGILKVYAQYLTALEVEFEIVLTASRFEYKFDPEFFNPNMLRAFLIYLPQEKKYIAPDRIDYRVGEAPANILGNKAMFLKNDLSYYFKKIEESDPNYSRVKRITDITFDEDLSKAIISMHQEYTGHWATTNRAILSLSGDQAIKEFKNYLTSSGVEDKEIISYEILNDTNFIKKLNA